MGGSSKKKKRKKSANSPDLNTEGTKQKKMADQPKSQKGSTQSQASNLSYMQLLQSGMNSSQSPYQAQYAVNNGAQNLSACFSPPPMQNVQNMQSTPQQQLPNTLPNMDVLRMVLARLDCIDSKLQRHDKIEKSVTDISLKVVDMNKKVVDLETKMAAVEQGQQFESDTLQEIEKKQSTLQKDLLTLKTSQQKLIETENRVKEQMLDLQCREMRDNLLFFNVPEERGETDSDCEQKILDIMQHDMEIENAQSNIKLHRTHRIGRYINGKTRPMVTKFAFFSDRERVRRAGARLRENHSHYSVGQQYPKEVQERRSALIPIMKQARDSGKDAYIVVDKLYIDKTLYRGPGSSQGGTTGLPNATGMEGVEQTQK